MPSLSSRVWVFPNRNSIGLAAILVAIWYAGASQSNGAAYMLCFVIAAIALVSALHTWVNLRGISLDIDPTTPTFAGEHHTFSIRVKATSRKACRGLELCIGNVCAALPEIRLKKDGRSELVLAADSRGHFDQVRITARSQYPLGFFTAWRQFTLSHSHYVYPTPTGHMPLPLAFDPAQETKEGLRTEGDDFAGVRSWRVGESMRHIDWKAVARGQPYLIKEWSGETGHRLMLDWETIPYTSTEDKLSQLARWVVLAEARGVDYGLQLPSRKISPGRGAAHYHECLRALACHENPEGRTQSNASRSESAPRNVIRPGAKRRRLELYPLFVLLGGVLLTAVPLIGQLPLWGILIFAACGVTRVAFAHTARRLSSIWLKLAVLALGVGGIVLNYGTLVGIEPGLSLLLLLVSLKMIESESTRDLHVLCLLGFFLCLCDLFSAQDLVRSLFIGGILVVLLSGLILLHTDRQEWRFPKALRFSLLLLAQALPIIILLFFLFPRTYAGFRFQFTRSPHGSTGMSDRMQPGSLASLALRDDIVFRAEFPDGKLPPQSDLYWRGFVLWQGDGFTWERGEVRSTGRLAGNLSGERIRQQIVLQPHGGRWLFALDRPANILGLRGATWEAGNFFQSIRTIVMPVRYEAVSRPGSREPVLDDGQRKVALYTPSSPSPAVRELVTLWSKDGASHAEVVRRAVRFFRQGGFTYSLAPGTYGQNAVDEFLFSRKSGFCEHFAGTFAWLMRVVGIPSRVVIGYHGGEYNYMGKHVTVRQADAHAWCEVWLEGSGWQRVDPTAAIAPDRIAAGLDSYLQSHSAQNSGAAGGERGGGAWRDVFREARLFWDNVTYQWDLRVLNFDEEAQRTFLMLFGIQNLSWSALGSLVAAAIVLVLALLGWWLRRPRSLLQDPAVIAYESFCRSLANVGAGRNPSEGPKDFTSRVAAVLPVHSEAVRNIGALYTSLRYGKGTHDPAPLIRAVKEFQRELRKSRGRPAAPPVSPPASTLPAH